MPRFYWAKTQRTRSIRRPKADAASSDASPRTYGFFRNRLFNDDAARNRAELEPIDHLTRSTTPRAGLVAIALGLLTVVAAMWLCLGSIDHSLWLTGKLLYAPVPDAQHNDVPEHLTRVETEIHLSDAQHLIAGRKVFVFRNDSPDTFLSGTIRAVHEPPRASPERPTATLRLDIERDPGSLPLPSVAGEDYRLRVPIGSQRPIELLLGFASRRPAREP